jgi:hypothetical protein
LIVSTVRTEENLKLLGDSKASTNYKKARLWVSITDSVNRVSSTTCYRKIGNILRPFYTISPLPRLCVFARGQYHDFSISLLRYVYISYIVIFFERQL